ncbi:MAG: thiamine pyrophosphate-dependent enzyme, partial [Clostridia bacterium]|nr:thiamine pyrophosphate-dependent enzyme [Clostridia bacterium]
TSDRPGPVLIDVPVDVQTAMFEYEPLPPVEKEPKQAAKDIRIEEAAATINSAKKPFIYIGGGVISGESYDYITELADKIDAPIGCSLMGLSAIPTDHPRFLGMQGMHGHYASSMGMHHADVIIALGNRFNDRVTGNKDKFAVNAKIVHIDIDGAELSKIVKPVNALRGDVSLTLEKLIPMLEKKENTEWNAELAEFKKKEVESYDTREGMTPRNAIMTLNRHLTEKTPVATDVGQHQMWAAQYTNLKNPRTFISSGGLGTMGFGMGAAIGAAFATGERTVLVTGDGSFGMNLNEMITAVNHNVPLVVLLLNNGVLGMVRQWQTLFYNKHYSNTVLDRKVDYVALTKAFGAEAELVTTPEELDKALATAFSHDGPYLIECRIDKDEFVLPMLPPGGSMDDIITEVKVGD